MWPEALLHTVPACGDFPCGSVVRTQHFHCMGGTKIPTAAWHGQEEKKLTDQHLYPHFNCTKAPPTVNHLGHRKTHGSFPSGSYRVCNPKSFETTRLHFLLCFAVFSLQLKRQGTRAALSAHKATFM